jgi:hypothetical protein
MGLGGGNSAAKKADQRETQRQAGIKAGVANINGIFDDPKRAAQRDDFMGALRTQLFGDLGKQRKVATRNLKFANARNGTTGGSQDVDSNAQLREDADRGTLDAERKVQAAGAGLQGDDEASRASLISLVQGGADTGTAAARAGASLQGNLQKALSSNTANSLGDVFGTTAGIWKTASEAAEKRRAQQMPVGSLYGGTSPWGG